MIGARLTWDWHLPNDLGLRETMTKSFGRNNGFVLAGQSDYTGLVCLVI